MKLTLILLTSLLLPSLTSLHAADEAKRRPNILFIAIDDLRPELGCYGDTQVKSPNIDKFASQALLFNRAYCQVPVCGASRASLMTSILPTPQRFTVAKTYVDDDTPGAVTLPQVFKQAGYTTLSNGKIFHFGTDTAERSWSEKAWHAPQGHATNLDPESSATKSKDGRNRIYESPDVADDAYPDGKTAARTIADLQRLKKDGKPFFLACGFLRPHLPFYAPKKYWDLYQRDGIRIADNRARPEDAPKGLHGSGEYKTYDFGGFKDNTDDFHRMMRHGYFAATSYSDKLVGDVLGELDRLELAQDTIVVIWGDHGWQLGEHNFWGKHNTMDDSVRVPLIIRVPGKAGGLKSNALVGVYDIFPTLCALAGLKVPDSVQGKSFVPLLDDPTQPFRESVFTRFGNGDAVVTPDFIYTTYGSDGEMLYNLIKDPQENHNIAANHGNREMLEKMQSLLKESQQTAADAKVAQPAKGKHAKDDDSGVE